MGIVNVTPDSFSDGGQFDSTSAALAHCERLVGEGADILDLGAESSRPGALALPLDEELRRLMPVLRLAVKLGVPVSVDTYKAEVMRSALDAGADIINDIWALRQAHALQVVASHPGCGVCLMHMHRDPTDMQLQPMQGTALPIVQDFLTSRVQALLDLGVRAQRIAIDPGIGFGKTLQQNLELLQMQHSLAALGYPLLVGWSRKGSLGTITGLDVQHRVVPSVVAALLAVQRGAHVVRVHDVAPTVAAMKVFLAATPTFRTH